MYFYFLLIRIAALFGHKKARKLVRGIQSQKDQIQIHQSAIWIHAASVGEFEQARPLIESIKRKNERQKVVVTFFSPSGYEARKNYELADGVYYLPLATYRNAKRFLNALQPKMAIFVKYEFWPAYLRELKKRNIPTYSISSIFRPDQYFFRWWGKSQLRVLKCFTHIFVQDEVSLRLLAKHGVRQVSVSGDTRFDRMNDVQKAKEKNTKVLTPVAQFAENSERVIVAGSTWPKDEELLAKYMKVQNDNAQGTKLILVPHEINEKHLHYLFNLFQGRFVRFSTASQMNDPVSRRNILQYADVMIIDTIGLLSSIYQFGQAAYIGGGFGVGIHNTIEAAAYGMPVIFGPKYKNFREAKGLIETGAARSIKNYSELESALETALEQHETIGIKASEYVQSELGATAKIFKQIFGNERVSD